MNPSASSRVNATSTAFKDTPKETARVVAVAGPMPSNRPRKTSTRASSAVLDPMALFPVFGPEAMGGLAEALGKTALSWGRRSAATQKAGPWLLASRRVARFSAINCLNHGSQLTFSRSPRPTALCGIE